MNDARSKNEQALLQKTGNPALAARVDAVRVGIWSGETSATSGGSVLAEALGEMLGRLWPNLDATGPLAAAFTTTARDAAASGNLPSNATVRWQPPYDFVIGIGSSPPTGAGPALRVGGSGWIAEAGPDATVNQDPNPVGPAAAATLAAVEVFKHVFSDGITTFKEPLPAQFTWDTWSQIGGEPGPSVQALALQNVHMIGVGAVTHGLLWLLARWPAAVTGALNMVDPDLYDTSNGQRYMGMRKGDVGRSKAKSWEATLKRVHPTLAVEGYAKGMNRYFAEDRPDCLVDLMVTGLDSAEARRQAGLKLPHRIVNMWTAGSYAGASRLGIGDGWPCPFCAYPEDTPAGAQDEVTALHQQTGLPPSRVRDFWLPAMASRPMTWRRSSHGSEWKTHPVLLDNPCEPLWVCFARLDVLSSRALSSRLTCPWSSSPSSPASWGLWRWHASCGISHPLRRGGRLRCSACRARKHGAHVDRSQSATFVAMKTYVNSAHRNTRDR